MWPSRVATCQSLVGCWGTRVVFLMANQRSTRVQRICKKLQTVKGAGASCLVSFLAVGDIFRERDLGCGEEMQRGDVSVMKGFFFFLREL